MVNDVLRNPAALRHLDIVATRPRPQCGHVKIALPAASWRGVSRLTRASPSLPLLPFFRPYGRRVPQHVGNRPIGRGLIKIFGVERIADRVLSAPHYLDERKLLGMLAQIFKF